MEIEDELLNLLLKCPNTEKILSIAEKVEFNHNFPFSKDKNDLENVWELRWINFNSPF